LLVGIALSHASQDSIPVTGQEKTQILKELNAKWDADLSGIVTWDVRFRRCHVSFENLKKFSSDDVVRLVKEIDKDKPSSLFDYFFDNLVDLNSHKKLKSSTQSLWQQLVSRNHFRYSGHKRWEQTTHPGGFESGGKPVKDFIGTRYTDEEKYVIYAELNRDVRIGNITNFHQMFAYMTDFLPQPPERVLWVDPQVFRNTDNPEIIYIETQGKNYEINQSQGTLLKQTGTIQGTVYEQIYLFDFFTPAKHLWLPRTILTIKYVPRAVLEPDYQGTGFIPYTVHINEVVDVRINEPFSDSAFHVSALKGCAVWDYRDDIKNPFVAQLEENVEDVASWVNSQKEPYSLTPRKNRVWLVLAINVIVIALIVWRIRAGKK